VPALHRTSARRRRPKKAADAWLRANK